MVDFIQHIVNGLSLGSIYALIALGYTMVFGILQLINFAHGDVYMLGAFVGFYMATKFPQYFPQMFATGQSSFLFFIVLIMAAMLICAIAGFLIERLAYRPLRNSPRINVLITAVGVSLFIEFSGQLIFGSDPKFFPSVYKPEGDWGFAGVVLNPMQIVVLGVSLVLMLLLQWTVFHTRLGRAMRAVSFNRDHAALMGIPTDRIISFTFMLGSALAGAAGILVATVYPKIEPLMGVMPGLKAFVAAVLGGIGNVTGAVVGAITLGIAESFIVAYWKPSFKDALAFGILILILLIKPTGLFGTNRVEKV